jgi:hypothetical protein
MINLLSKGTRVRRSEERFWLIKVGHTSNKFEKRCYKTHHLQFIHFFSSCINEIPNMCKWIMNWQFSRSTQNSNHVQKNSHSFDSQNWDIHTPLTTMYLKSLYCGDLPIGNGQIFCSLQIVDKERGISSTNFILQREVPIR